MYIHAISTTLSFVAALVLHEMGHFFAARAYGIRVTQAGFGWGPSLFDFRVNGVDYNLRLFPVGAYIRMDMADLQQRPVFQQLFILLAGIGVNLILGAVAWGTFFGTVNLVLAIANLFPLYQQDGWKTGMVILRRVFGRESPIVEWSFTLSAGVVALIIMFRALSSW